MFRYQNGLLGGMGFGPAGMVPMDDPSRMGRPRMPAPITVGVPEYAAPEQQNSLGLLGTLGQAMSDPQSFADVMNTLAVGFGGMTLRGQGPMSQVAMANLAESRKRRETQAETSQYIDYLKNRGVITDEQAAQLANAPRLAAALTQGAISRQFAKPTETFAVLSGAELAKQGVLGADPNKLYNLSSTGQLSQVGGSDTNITVGGQTLTPGFEALDKEYAKEHIAWTRGGGSDMKRQIAQVGTVLNKLQSGEALTGNLVNFAPDIVQAIFAPEDLAAKQQVEDVVQRNLRVVLGAQFTEREGERLISRAFDARLKPAENINRLQALFSQMSVSAQQRDEMAQYFAKNGTLMGYSGPQPKLEDFYTALSSKRVGDIVTDPSTGEKYEYIGGDETIESSWRKVN